MEECNWMKGEDEGGEIYWDTSCGHTLCSFEDTSLKENEFKFCPYCGGKIVECEISDVE